MNLIINCNPIIWLGCLVIGRHTHLDDNDNNDDDDDNDDGL